MSIDDRKADITQSLKFRFGNQVEQADLLLRHVLVNVGTWHCDGFNFKGPDRLWRIYTPIIEELAQKQLIKVRMHYAKMCPQGVKAWEITDEGLDVLEQLDKKITGRVKFYEEAIDDRNFYRNNTTLEAFKKQASALILPPGYSPA